MYWLDCTGLQVRKDCKWLLPGSFNMLSLLMLLVILFCFVLLLAPAAS